MKTHGGERRRGKRLILLHRSTIYSFDIWFFLWVIQSHVTSPSFGFDQPQESPGPLVLILFIWSWAVSSFISEPSSNQMISILTFIIHERVCVFSHETFTPSNYLSIETLSTYFSLGNCDTEVKSKNRRNFLIDFDINWRGFPITIGNVA